MKKFETLETGRLTMKLPSAEDAPFIREMYNSPGFIKYVGNRNIRTNEDAERYIIEKFMPQVEAEGFGNYIITHRESGKKIGAVGIFIRPGMDAPDIGFSLLPEFEGKGYGYESAKKLLDTAFREFGISEISAMPPSGPYLYCFIFNTSMIVLKPVPAFTGY